MLPLSRVLDHHLHASAVERLVALSGIPFYQIVGAAGKLQSLRDQLQGLGDPALFGRVWLNRLQVQNWRDILNALESVELVDLAKDIEEFLIGMHMMHMITHKGSPDKHAHPPHNVFKNCVVREGSKGKGWGGGWYVVHILFNKIQLRAFCSLLRIIMTIAARTITKPSRGQCSGVDPGFSWGFSNCLRWWYTPAIMIFMTFFLVKYLAKGAGTEAK